MKAKAVQRMLDNNLKESQEPQRNYLGMSSAGLCPLAWYKRMVEVKAEYDVRMAFYGLAGYALEAAIVQHLEPETVPVKICENTIYEELLGQHVVRVNRELVATFDCRYRGHIDHELPDGTLVECKTVTWEKFLKLQAWKTAPNNHSAQVQAYMRHGQYDHGVIIYVPRDIDYGGYRLARHFPFYVVDVRKDKHKADQLDKKAQQVLAAMDSGEPPRCGCGRCR